MMVTMQNIESMEIYVNNIKSVDLSKWCNVLHRLEGSMFEWRPYLACCLGLW
jgi:hypothetical protein